MQQFLYLKYVVPSGVRMSVLILSVVYSTFTHNMYSLGLPRELCLEFLRKQSAIANLREGKCRNTELSVFDTFRREKKVYV